MKLTEFQKTVGLATTVATVVAVVLIWFVDRIDSSDDHTVSLIKEAKADIRAEIGPQLKSMDDKLNILIRRVK